jgi:hypothetical protein
MGNPHHHDSFDDDAGSPRMLRLIGGPRDGEVLAQVEEDPPEEVRLPHRTPSGMVIVDCYRLDPFDPQRRRLLYAGYDIID